ncbi:MAG: ABC transporter ATP-binding protein [Burkholderiaceae bacterium]
MLRVENLQVFYGASQAVFDVSFEIARGQVATLLGRNGMGKTTTVHAITGIVRAAAGKISFEDRRLDGQAAHRIARAGLGLVPEGRQIFPNLSTEENLVVAARPGYGGDKPWTLERVYRFFPSLANRRRSMGNLLSGGEQQMLAIGRALMTNPKLLILDEATEGLAPLVRAEIWSGLAALKADGLSILVIDKNISDLLKLADTHTILEKGRVVWHGGSAELAADGELQHRYLGI